MRRGRRLGGITAHPGAAGERAGARGRGAPRPELTTRRRARRADFLSLEHPQNSGTGASGPAEGGGDGTWAERVSDSVKSLDTPSHGRRPATDVLTPEVRWCLTLRAGLGAGGRGWRTRGSAEGGRDFVDVYSANAEVSSSCP